MFLNFFLLLLFYATQSAKIFSLLFIHFQSLKWNRSKWQFLLHQLLDENEVHLHAYLDFRQENYSENVFIYIREIE